jgi:hypothetical protein
VVCLIKTVVTCLIGIEDGTEDGADVGGTLTNTETLATLLVL